RSSSLSSPTAMSLPNSRASTSRCSATTLTRTTPLTALCPPLGRSVCLLVILWSTTAAAAAAAAAPSSDTPKSSTANEEKYQTARTAEGNYASSGLSGEGGAAAASPSTSVGRCPCPCPWLWCGTGGGDPEGGGAVDAFILSALDWARSLSRDAT